MSESNVVRIERPEIFSDPLTEMLRRDARKLIKKALEVELAELMSVYEDRTDDRGRSAVVRNGYHPEREILTGIGPVVAKVPKVRSRTDEPVVFHSALVPTYVRKAKSVTAAIPWPYLTGISNGLMRPALAVMVGPEATGLYTDVFSRLNQ